MADTMLRVRRRRAQGRLAEASLGYGALGWPVCPGVRQPAAARGRGATAPRACSCDRIGCPAPGAHPVSPVWQRQASTDPLVIGRWWDADPGANIVLATGRSFDALDVPAAAGDVALTRLERSGPALGPVAISAGNRMLFFVASRSRLADDEWWSSQLDCVPDLPQSAGLRWHCKGSYVLAPPSRFSAAAAARWLREPAGGPLPDALALLEPLADACDAVQA